ncbi:Kinase protein with adenine nucleotide alpha hydrolases-like domain isoform 1 [Dorcoceras hygrometricum]|uniref:Kinase protein with adenine nucleotide alpha hydrolases-like domain isoform 1 n=1 Tax=Dorcoceras hygrometricum TaxID=472368 RepID=A0A2Z7AF40_9LAMI|nr:Kinase protein with adenine nucleotide alpha hydrolases-like domain isoform 1 [Dorcoceras hygrometricum]
MTAESLDLGRKLVIVGIRLDCHTKELLDWAVVKVADTGDAVVAVHVCRNSDSISKEEALLEGYLEDYKGLCSKKQVDLTVEVFKAKSIRKVLVMEAKNYSASVVVVGITKHTALGGWASVAKYCAKRLPPSTEVMAVHNGRIVFSRFSTHQLQGPGKDPKPSFCLTEGLISKDNQSEFGESEISEISRLSYDGIEGISMATRDEVFRRISRVRRGSLSSLSLPVDDFTNQRPGWPLLQTPSFVTRPALEARNMSVVKWVMSLPYRPLLNITESRSETDELEDEGTIDEVTKRQELPKDLELVLEKNSPGCEVYSYHALKIATSEFSSGNLIGKGGCNSVYKGILSEGKPVAVKILRSSKEAWEDFILEVEIITTAKHKRITPLLGICIEDNNLISVYDFLSKGNLEESLHGGDKKNPVLSWEVRFKIALGIAEALNYIHNRCPKPIIHRDIKSSNILLTDELEPQLSDFGLAIWGPTAASFLTDDNIVGTFGYLAPEYFMYGKVSDKIDVYAFGVVLLELLSGRKPIVLDTEKGQESLIMWARPKLESGDFRSILDPDLALDDKGDGGQIQRMAQAARLCLTQAARLRPKMCQILNILLGDEHEHEGSTPTSANYDDLDYQNDNDDEVYPDLRAESHLSLAFFDVYESSTSFSSMDQSSPLSVEEFVKKTWSRSSSFK